MLMINELMVTLYLYVLLMLTDYNDSVDAFDTLAGILLGVIVVAFFSQPSSNGFQLLGILSEGSKKVETQVKKQSGFFQLEIS